MADSKTAAPASGDIVGMALQRAVELRTAKEAVYEQIAANRRFLRDLSIQGLLTEEQSAWVQEHYPPKQKGSTAEENGNDGE